MLGPADQIISAYWDLKNKAQKVGLSADHIMGQRPSSGHGGAQRSVWVKEMAYYGQLIRSK